MNRAASPRLDVPVAAETWIATALLHREHPERSDFTIQEIVGRAEAEHVTPTLRPGVRVHASTHCVANRKPDPVAHRMLYATGKHTRRLFREGDDFHPLRHGRTFPAPHTLPEKYRYLLDWYQNEYTTPARDGWLSGIFAMIGAGRDIFAGIDPDEYVRKLRAGWE